MTDQEKAIAAANTWCRCYKCDGVARNLVSENMPAVTFKCEKDKLRTCNQWYDCFRTALIALNWETK